MNRSTVDFDHHLTQGAHSYDSPVGTWWKERTTDQAHQEAYSNIARQTHQKWYSEHKDAPQCIVDYACGNGALIRELLKVFPYSRFVGIDASSDLLQDFNEHPPTGVSSALIEAEDIWLSDGPQVRLFHSRLPNFSIPEGQADIALFCFPNLIADEEDEDVFNQNGYCHEDDSSVGQMLARFQEMDPEDEQNSENSDDVFDELMTNRVFSLNLHHCLRPRGMMVRVEYTNAHRSELSLLTQWRTHFGECSLNEEIKNESSRLFFQYSENRYYPSEVILDVFHQTGDESDREGGYGMSFLEVIAP
jgi:SAM-dependent methyltransferase